MRSGDTGVVIIPDQLRREGWPGQLRRVERWRDRFLAALEQSQTGLEDQDVIDYLFAFAQAGYHLRDWIQTSGSATQAQLDRLMSETPALGRCRDLCNASKHLAVNGSHRYQRIAMMQECRGEGYRIRMIAFQPRGGGADYMHIQELVESVVEAWQEFCCNLPPSRDSWDPALSWS